MLYAGVDIGSVSTDTVIVSNTGKSRSRGNISTDASFAKAAEAALRWLLKSWAESATASLHIASRLMTKNIYYWGK